MNEQHLTNDHDILIELRTNVKNLTDEVRLMRDNTKEQVNQKADKSALQEARNDFANSMKVQSDENARMFKGLYEMQGKQATRLDKVEKIIYIGLGILGAIQFLISVAPIIEKFSIK